MKKNGKSFGRLQALALLHDFLQRQGIDWEKVPFAKLAYFPAISGNSGLQKGRALGENHGIFPPGGGICLLAQGEYLDFGF